MAYYHPTSPYSWPGFTRMLDHPDQPYYWTYLEKQDGMTWEIPVCELPLNHPSRTEFVPVISPRSSKVRCTVCGASGHRGGAVDDSASAGSRAVQSGVRGGVDGAAEFEAAQSRTVPAVTGESTNRAIIAAALAEGGGHRFRWPPCAVCGHGRIVHHPERGGGWRCRWTGRKRAGQRCGCMRYRGTVQVTRVPTKGE